MECVISISYTANVIDHAQHKNVANINNTKQTETGVVKRCKLEMKNQTRLDVCLFFLIENMTLCIDCLIATRLVNLMIRITDDKAM